VGIRFFLAGYLPTFISPTGLTLGLHDVAKYAVNHSAQIHSDMEIAHGDSNDSHGTER
jgi:hypothetical protein